MIGIPILDNLSEEDLVKVATGKMRIRVLEKMSSIPTTEIMLNDDPALISPMKDIDNDRVITMCKMEIESRLGWLYLAEQLEKLHDS